MKKMEQSLRTQIQELSDNTTDLLLKLDNPKSSTTSKFYELAEYFRICDKNTITLTFRQIEEIIGEIRA